MSICSELSRIIPSERLLEGPAAERAYDCDAYTVDKSKPSAIALPESTDEVASIVKWCCQNEVPFTPRGAGTGLSGGALAALGGVIISTKKMTHILEVDVPNRRMLAQTGIANLKLSQAVAASGLHFAPDPSSQSVSTLGGNIAENSGGPHTLKYGVTAQHIAGLKMVSPEGDIWDLGSKEGHSKSVDLCGLVVGSEGTLGIVTESWVKLTPLPMQVSTALVAFTDVRPASEAVAAIIASGVVPAALEMMDKGILAALQAAFGLQFPERSQALLLVECDQQPGESPATEQMEKVAKLCREQGAIDVTIATDEADRQRLWTARKKGIGAMGRLAPSIVTHDGVIPRSKLPEMLDFVYEVAALHNIRVANLFHAGDGNLHPCFYFDEREAGAIERVVEAGEAIVKRCIDLGGSISGEHGIGVEKQELMPLMFTPEDLALQAQIKAIFNQNSLCNPCKVLPNQKHCVEHKKRWRGVAW
ncbi:MAG: FAD-linked oxidase C-terminal domain-containing protein [Fimbriimonadaceae bacterium]